VRKTCTPGSDRGAGGRLPVPTGPSDPWPGDIFRESSRQQGQNVIATSSSSYEYPIVSGVAAPKLLTPFNQLAPAPLSAADLGDGQAAIMLLQQAQML
jgi:hypothetical protein